MSTEKRNVDLPANISYEHKGSCIEFSRKWARARYIGLLVFSIFWLAFLYQFFSGGVSNEMLLFSSGHILIGIGMLYFSIGGLMNSTRIIADREFLLIKHGPVPFPGSKVKSSDIRQLYIKDRVYYVNNQKQTSYDIYMQADKQKKGKRLMKNFSDYEQARFVEQELERYLLIKDRHVPGETVE